MFLVRSCGVAVLSFLLAGCVSLSKYNQRMSHIQVLEGEMAALEKTLDDSESIRKGIETDLRGTKKALAQLQEEHESLKSRAMVITTDPDDISAINAEKRQFAEELAALIGKLAEADSRIKELSTLLAAKEAAVRRIPTLEAAVVEREQQIKDLTTSLQSLESYILQIKKDATELSRRRSGNEEKEQTFAAVRILLREEIDDGEITVREYRDKMILGMKEQVLFRTGRADISRSGRKTLDRVAKVLGKIRNNQVVVEGHTDTLPFRKTARRYRSNWDLAAARAVNVVRYLEENGRVKPELLALAGYSSYLPATANDSAANRRLNRRIEIAVIPLETERLAAVRNRNTLSRR